MPQLVPVSIPFVFLNNPFGWAYLEPAVPYVLLSCAALYPLAQRILERPQMLVFVALAVMVLAVQIEQFVASQLNRRLWTVAAVHNLSVIIASHVKEGVVATLYPMLVS